MGRWSGWLEWLERAPSAVLMDDDHGLVVEFLLELGND